MAEPLSIVKRHPVNLQADILHLLKNTLKNIANLVCFKTACGAKIKSADSLLVFKKLNEQVFKVSYICDTQYFPIVSAFTRHAKKIGGPGLAEAKKIKQGRGG